MNGGVQVFRSAGARRISSPGFTAASEQQDAALRVEKETVPAVFP